MALLYSNKITGEKDKRNRQTTECFLARIINEDHSILSFTGQPRYGINLALQDGCDLCKFCKNSKWLDIQKVRHLNGFRGKHVSNIVQFINVNPEYIEKTFKLFLPELQEFGLWISHETDPCHLLNDAMQENIKCVLWLAKSLKIRTLFQTKFTSNALTFYKSDLIKAKEYVTFSTSIYTDNINDVKNFESKEGDTPRKKREALMEFKLNGLRTIVWPAPLLFGITNNKSLSRFLFNIADEIYYQGLVLKSGDNQLPNWDIILGTRCKDESGNVSFKDGVIPEMYPHLIKDYVDIYYTNHNNQYKGKLYDFVKDFEQQTLSLNPNQVIKYYYTEHMNYRKELSAKQLNLLVSGIKKE